MAIRRLPSELELELYSLECPFNWMKEFSGIDLYSEGFSVEYVANKFKTVNDDFLHFGFPTGICLIYEYSIKNQSTEKVREVLDTCEKLLNCVIEDSKKKENKSNELINKVKVSYQHIFQSCKVFYQLHCGEMEALQDLLNNIPKSKSFNSGEQACVYGIKAAFLMSYGPFENILVSIDCAKRAIELDGAQGWYYFLAGKGLCRHRRRYKMNTPVQTEEIRFMEQAKQFGFRNEEVIMSLIEMYAEVKTFFSNDGHQKDYYKETEGLCRSLCETSTDWYYLFRCCRALLRFRKCHINFDLIHEWLQKADTLSPKHPQILVVIGKAYSLQNKTDVALYYAKSAAKENDAIAFVMNAIHSHYINSYRLGVDILPVFNEYIDAMQNSYKKHLIMGYKARYLLLVRQDINGAFQLAVELIEKNPTCLQEKKTACVEELRYLLLKLLSEILTYVTRYELNSYDKKLDELKHMYPVLKEVKPSDTVQFKTYNKNNYISWLKIEEKQQKSAFVSCAVYYEEGNVASTTLQLLILTLGVATRKYSFPQYRY